MFFFFFIKYISVHVFLDSENPDFFILFLCIKTLCCSSVTVRRSFQSQFFTLPIVMGRNLVKVLSLEHTHRFFFCRFFLRVHLPVSGWGVCSGSFRLCGELNQKAFHGCQVEAASLLYPDALVSRRRSGSWRGVGAGKAQIVTPEHSLTTQEQIHTPGGPKNMRTWEHESQRWDTTLSVPELNAFCCHLCSSIDYVGRTNIICCKNVLLTFPLRVNTQNWDVSR